MACIPNYRQDQAVSLIVNQLIDDLTYVDMIKLIASTYDDQDAVLCYISTISIDTAEGVWLDLIGRIVGRSRLANVELPYKYFGCFDVNPDAGGLGSILYQPGMPLNQSSRMNDFDYRKAIKAQAVSNSGDVTMFGVTSLLVDILDTDDVIIESVEDAQVDITIRQTLSPIMEALIKSGDFVPLAAGVTIRDIVINEALFI